jgi:hypothetical protein
MQCECCCRRVLCYSCPKIQNVWVLGSPWGLSLPHLYRTSIRTLGSRAKCVSVVLQWPSIVGPSGPCGGWGRRAALAGRAAGGAGEWASELAPPDTQTSGRASEQSRRLSPFATNRPDHAPPTPLHKPPPTRTFWQRLLGEAHPSPGFVRGPISPLAINPWPGFHWRSHPLHLHTRDW